MVRGGNTDDIYVLQRASGVDSVGLCFTHLVLTTGLSGDAAVLFTLYFGKLRHEKVAVQITELIGGPRLFQRV